MPMQIIDLFSGIGGFSLAGRWLGWQTVSFCEIDPFCQKVLAKNFPGVPITADIRELKGSDINYDKSKSAIIVGGFPCQPFSVAGKRRGTDDARYLWPEMLRVISEVRPTWIVAENVRGFTTINNGLEFERACTDLEALGYDVQPFIIPARAVGAPHKRDRVWVVAHTNGERESQSKGAFGEIRGRISDGCFETVAYSDGQRWITSVVQSGSSCETLVGSSRRQPLGADWLQNWYEVATRICRMDDGLSGGLDRVNRIKSLGNSIVPQIAYMIFRTINEINNLE